jgi:NAD(P)H dehydrogenase (quinone)
MRVLVLFAHPCDDSFVSALHRTVVATLTAAGHEVDDCDLYAEAFEPVLTAPERRAYHDVPANRASVAGYVDRLERAEALVLVFPVWNFGFPAILKGFFDRVFLPGVSFDLVDGTVRGALGNIRRLVAVTSYGGSRLRAVLAGDPPRHVVKRAIRAAIHPMARCRYLALYDMNRATPERRARFLARVEGAIGRL